MLSSLRGHHLALALVLVCVLATSAQAQPRSQPARTQDKPQERSVDDWLARIHEAAGARSYVGTFVVSSSGGALSSARIWHAGDAPKRSVARVESLSGPLRSTFRRGEEVITLVPHERVVRREYRDAVGHFPDLLKVVDSSVSEFYEARRTDVERVAGLDADVVHFAPRDKLRFGYRVWSERRTGLAVKLQTLDEQGNVLEQTAFSELQLDPPLRAEKLVQMMGVPAGWRVERDDAQKTTPAQEGWTLRVQVPGFRAMSCYRRFGEGAMQWVFSDGLASVSLFVENYDRQRHTQEGVFASGATHTLLRRVQDWWLTAVGEVPPQTLRAFADSLERRK